MNTRVRTWIAPGLFWAFLAGIALGWWLRGGAPVPPGATARAGAAPATRLDALLDEPSASVAGDERKASLPLLPAAAPGASVDQPTAPTFGADPIAELRRRLRLPLAQVNVEALKGSFDEGRDRGARPHEAVDMMAPRNTPIRAVEDGVIAKLFSSKAGGLTVYQFDSAQTYCYYYAHLEKYAAGLEEGTRVRAGDVIGYVGSSGNASPSAPHLHFAIFKLTDPDRWWEGTPIDPYRVFSGPVRP